jgi:hypothetical protein
MKIYLSLFTLFVTKTFCQIDVPCGNASCPTDQGVCINIDNGQECICDNKFTTYPPESDRKCNYTKKSRLTAFLLELFLTYGIGHFYAGQYYLAVPKFFFFCFNYCLFVYLRMVVRNNEYNNNTSKLIVFMAYVFLILMVGWQIADLVLYGRGIYRDGNGIDLIPW